MRGDRSEREARVDTLPAAEAVEQLIRDYGRLVFHIIYGLTSDWQISEDLTQDTFVQALKAIDAARAASGAHFHPRAWLVRIALNTVNMHRRRHRLFQFVPFSQLQSQEAGAQELAAAPAPVQPGGYGPTEGGDPASLVAERDAVRRSLAGLPETLRIPLLLSTVGGFSATEIAHMLDVGEAAIRQRLSRARRLFQQLYAGESGEVVSDPVVATEARSVSIGPGVNRRLAVSSRLAPVAAGPYTSLDTPG